MHPITLAETIDGPRACRPYELAPTLDVGTAVMRLEQGADPNWGHSWPHIYTPDNLANVRIIKVDEQVVSSMAILPTTVQAQTAQGEAVTLTVGGINGVATLPAFRRRGFGGQLLQDCHAKMMADGCDIALLSTGIDNWYRRFGWENGGQQWSYTLDRRSCTYLPPLDSAVTVEVVATATAALDEIAALHSQEALGARRRRDLYPSLLFRLEGRLYCARQAGRLLAYVVVRNQQILEYGGATEPVAGLIRTVFTHLDDRSRPTSGRDAGGEPRRVRLTIHTPPRRTGLSQLLNEVGLPYSRTYLGMIRVINLPQLLRKVAPQCVVSEESEEQVVLTDGATQQRLTRGDLVKWLFGPERFPALTIPGLPLTFYQWPLDWV
ncbi:MAG: GNAT family N-acetyltransferase [Caldilineaceae bacterium]